MQIGGRTVTNLGYADDIVLLLAGSDGELQELVDRLDSVSLCSSILMRRKWRSKWRRTL